jgi:hypothetical protein
MRWLARHFNILARCGLDQQIGEFGVDDLMTVSAVVVKYPFGK